MTNSDFQVRNGLVVNNSILVVNAAANSISLVSNTFYVNSTSFSFGNTSSNVSVNSTSILIGGISVGTAKAQTLTFIAGGTAWNTANGIIATVVLSANVTFSVPTNLTTGSLVLFVQQDATGAHTATWPSIFKWPGATPPILSAAPSATDLFSFIYNGTNLYGTYINNLG
jgi:hypothetical protein